ncbi:MAG TPA: GGDEF domain-containing protein [Candidatus Acidoferrales bacterium]|nr:GGDEF domain-containing protein [Candidatus Acidoferrales bacterium]
MLILKNSAILRRNLRIGGEILFACFLVALAGRALQHTGIVTDVAIVSGLQTIGAFLNFTFAANAIVRYRGSRDRVALILAIGLVVVGIAGLGGAIELFRDASQHPRLFHVPVLMLIAPTVFALTLLVAPEASRRLTTISESDREILSVLTIVAATSFVTFFAYAILVSSPRTYANAIFPRPWDLLPAGLFLAATVVYYRRAERTASALDSALHWAAGLNVASHLLASQSVNPLDVAGAAAQFVEFASFALLLGATLVDNARLFERVRQLAISDSLTGLANYRRLAEVLQTEIERSDRTGRPFSLLLMDLDKLKAINDRYGHVTGSRAISRVGAILRAHSRSIDTAARYGGDEFALVLPETDVAAASRVGQRIRQFLAVEKESPRLSVSIGVATFPADGASVEHLLAAADRELYRLKNESKARAATVSIASTGKLFAD